LGDEVFAGGEVVVHAAGLDVGGGGDVGEAGAGVAAVAEDDRGRREDALGAGGEFGGGMAAGGGGGLDGGQFDVQRARCGGFDGGESLEEQCFHLLSELGLPAWVFAAAATSESRVPE
jgi:hypothetical protein